MQGRRSLDVGLDLPSLIIEREREGRRNAFFVSTSQEPTMTKSGVSRVALRINSAAA
jgi:hypothetical protein